MFLEAIHLYSLVGWVVRRGGLMNAAQVNSTELNTVVTQKLETWAGMQSSYSKLAQTLALCL